MERTKKKISLDRINVVGTIHCLKGLEAVRREKARLDAVEVRVDSLPHPVGADEVRSLGLPAIVTVRDPAEGGGRMLPLELRRDLYLELLPAAAGIDIEARNLRVLRSVVEAAGRCPVIASFHDFLGVPSKRALAGMARRAHDEGAQCVKVAARVESADDMARFLDGISTLGVPFAAMGMGPLGRVSRLLLAQCGSCLNYGWLGSPQVPGQWPAKDLGKLIDLVGKTAP